MNFGLRCSQPACRPHPASLPVRVPAVESLLRASFSFTSRLRLAFRYGYHHRFRLAPFIQRDSAHAGHTGAGLPPCLGWAWGPRATMTTRPPNLWGRGFCPAAGLPLPPWASQAAVPTLLREALPASIGHSRASALPVGQPEARRIRSGNSFGSTNRFRTHNRLVNAAH
jgi:hypothetical protein